MGRFVCINENTQLLYNEMVHNATDFDSILKRRKRFLEPLSQNRKRMAKAIRSLYSAKSASDVAPS